MAEVFGGCGGGGGGGGSLRFHVCRRVCEDCLGGWVMRLLCMATVAK